MNTLFVYYKLPLDQHASTRQRLWSMTETLTQRIPGIQIDLMQRPEISPERLETWMEVYRHPSGVSSDNIRQIEEAARDAGMPEPRRYEVFVTLR